MHIRFLIFKGLFKLHKCARNSPVRHSGPHEQFSKKCCQSGWSLKRTRERTELSSRRFARLSEPCTLKRAFIGPEMQKSHFQCKNPKNQVLTSIMRLGYLKNSLEPVHGNNLHNPNKSVAKGTNFILSIKLTFSHPHNA